MSFNNNGFGFDSFTNVNGNDLGLSFNFNPLKSSDNHANSTLKIKDFYYYSPVKEVFPEFFPEVFSEISPLSVPYLSANLAKKLFSSLG